jgi:hypothetical protein
MVDKTMKPDAESRNCNQFPKMRFKNYTCSYGSNVHNMVAQHETLGSLQQYNMDTLPNEMQMKFTTEVNDEFLEEIQTSHRSNILKNKN